MNLSEAYTACGVSPAFPRDMADMLQDALAAKMNAGLKGALPTMKHHGATKTKLPGPKKLDVIAAFTGSWQRAKQIADEVGTDPKYVRQIASVTPWVQSRRMSNGIMQFRIRPEADTKP